MLKKSLFTALLLVGIIGSSVLVLEYTRESEDRIVSSTQDNPAGNDSSIVDGVEDPSSNAGSIERSSKTVPSDQVLPYKSKFGHLPDSLEGTIMRQALAVDEDGHIRISSDLRRVFDFFLSAVEEEELEIILGRINEYLDYYLDEPALSESQQVLDQYVSLKTALFDFEVERSEYLQSLIESGELANNKALYLELLEEQLQARTAMRSEHLSPDVYESFYADEEAYDDYTLSRLKVESDKTLSTEEKQSRLAAIDASAPADIVESRQEAQITDTLKQRTQQVINAGGTQEDVRALRTEMFGEEAAERFSELDQARAEWKSRVDSYMAQRQSILAEQGLSADEQQAQIDNLRTTLFDTREQIRVRVYESKSDV